MTPDQRAKLEQVARELWNVLEGARPYFGPTKDLPVKAIMEALAAQRAAVLEEAAQLVEESMRPGSRFAMREILIDYLRQQAREQRP